MSRFKAGGLPETAGRLSPGRSPDLDGHPDRRLAVLGYLRAVRVILEVEAGLVLAGGALGPVPAGGGRRGNVEPGGAVGREDRIRTDDDARVRRLQEGGLAPANLGVRGGRR